MRMVRNIYAGFVVAALTGIVFVGAAEARVSTEVPGSILIFPKVINSASRDTVIQITNTMNLTAYAHCFYLNGTQSRRDQTCQVSDFDLVLTRMQPTFWQVSAGRSVNPSDATGGIDPGLIPPAAPGFTGALVCVQVDAGGTPTGMNALKGEATVGSVSNGLGVSKYNATAIPAASQQTTVCADSACQDLLLDNIHYAGCPAALQVNFVADGASDDIIENLGNGTSSVNSSLSFVPCSLNFESLIPTSETLSFLVEDEMEVPLSASIRIGCWGEASLGDPLGLGAAMSSAQLGSTYGTARITPTSGVGVLGVLNVERAGQGGLSTAATNLHMIGNTASTSLEGAVIEVSR